MDSAAHGKVGPGVDTAEVTQRAIRELQKMDEEKDSRQIGPEQDADEEDEEQIAGHRDRKGGRGRAGRKGKGKGKEAKITRSQRQARI